MLTQEQIHQKEIDSLIKQISDKRAELRNEASRLLSEFEPRLKSIRKEVADATYELEKLNSLIEERKIQAESVSKTAEAHYKNLEELLKNEYIKRKKELDDKEIRLENKSDDIIKIEDSIASKEKIIADKEVGISVRELEHDKDVQDFQSYRLSEQENIDSKKNHILQQNQLLDDRIKKIEDMEHDLIYRINCIENKEKKCDEILLKINNAEKFLSEARKIESSNKARSEELNELNVTILAEKRRNNSRSDLLTERELKLKQQEDNLKLAREELFKE